MFDKFSKNKKNKPVPKAMKGSTYFTSKYSKSKESQVDDDDNSEIWYQIKRLMKEYENTDDPKRKEWLGAQIDDLINMLKIDPVLKKETKKNIESQMENADDEELAKRYKK